MNKYRFNNEVDPETGKEKHLHEFLKDGEWKPLTGTSTVCKVIAKPLTWWASELACQTYGWMNSRKRVNGKYITIPIEERISFATPIHEKVKLMTIEEYLKHGDRAYRAHDCSLDKSAKKGTDLHAELERFVKSRMGKNKETNFDPKITPFIEWADKNVKRFIASEANCFSERLWTGGITDCIAEMNDGTLAVIDFKSAKEAYKSHFIQCAGYAIQLEESGMCDSTGKHCKPLPEITCPHCHGDSVGEGDAGCICGNTGKTRQKISQLIVVPFGSARVSPVIMRGIDEFKKAFEAAVVLYRLLENYEE